MIYIIFLYSLILTILVKGLIISILYRKLRFVYHSVLCNLLTDPLLNLLLLIAINLFGNIYYFTALVILEVAIVLAEAVILKLLCVFKLSYALLIISY